MATRPADRARNKQSRASVKAVRARCHDRDMPTLAEFSVYLIFGRVQTRILCKIHNNCRAAVHHCPGVHCALEHLHNMQIALTGASVRGIVSAYHS